MSVILSPEIMAKITKGHWRDNRLPKAIEGVEHVPKYVEEGDMFVIFPRNCSSVSKVLSCGVQIVMTDLQCDIDLPEKIFVLIVEDSYSALRAIALESTRLSHSKRVLVTGSFGKTGFKVHLYHLLFLQYRTSAKLTSSNRIRSLYTSLASVSENDEVLIIEQPIEQGNKMRRHAKYVQPDVAVITAIGHEHIEKFGSVEAIAKQKTEISASLQSDGILILPHDDPYYALLKKEVRKKSNCTIKTFGESPSSDARLLYKSFRNFGWDVIVKIVDRIVAYHIPFPDIHEPIASLAVMLTIHCLGGDVEIASKHYYRVRNFKSSGKLYDVEYKDKHFYLYDQSHRGGIESYDSFFQTLKYLQPYGNGKKILLTSEFVDYDDGEMELIDYGHFRKRIAEAKIDIIYTVEKFSEHFQVLPDKNQWKRHSIDFNNLKEEILENITSGDILCVKGIYESSLPQFINWIKRHKNIKLSEKVNTDIDSGIHKAFSSLRTISIEDKNRYIKAISKTEKKSWSAYFPFLLSWNLSASREVLISYDNGTITLYLLRGFLREKRPSFYIFMPPFPMTNETVLEAARRQVFYKGKDRGTILWVEEEEKALLSRKAPDINFTYVDRDSDEYLYDPNIYNDLKGTKFRHLRKDIKLINNLNGVEVLPYSSEMKKECLELLEEWERSQGGKYIYLEDRGYTRVIFDIYKDFTREELFGIVIRVNGKIRSFGFAGKIKKGIGSFFIGKSDLSVKGLHTYMRYELLKRMKEYKLINDSYAVSEGMAFSKRMFRPVGMLKQYKAKLFLKKVNPERLNSNDINEIMILNRSPGTHIGLSEKKIKSLLTDDEVYGIWGDNREFLEALIILKVFKKKMRIYQLMVKNEYKDEGLESILLSLVEKLAQKKGVKVIYLEVETNNFLAITLYERFGFRIEGYLYKFCPDGSSAFRMEMKL